MVLSHHRLRERSRLPGLIYQFHLYGHRHFFPLKCHQNHPMSRLTPHRGPPYFPLPHSQVFLMSLAYLADLRRAPEFQLKDSVIPTVAMGSGGLLLLILQEARAYHRSGKMASGNQQPQEKKLQLLQTPLSFL